jgi:hypothetical protein
VKDELQTICETLLQNSRARSVALIGPGAQGDWPIAAAGDELSLDEESMAERVGDRWGETIYGLLEAREWTVPVQRPPGQHLHVAAVPGGGGILLVLFDDQTSLGLVRLRVKKAIEEIAKLKAGGSSGEGGATGGAAPLQAALGLERKPTLH